jgi:hypothetical protein
VSLRPRDLLGKQCTCTNHAARHDKLTIEEQGTCIVAWNGTAAPHTQQIVRLIRYTVRACYTSWVQTIPYRAAAVRPRLPGNSPTGNRITGMHAAGQVAGCGAQLRSTARLPSQFRQSLPAARVVTHKTEASVRVSPQSAGMEHPGRSCLTLAP